MRSLRTLIALAMLVCLFLTMGMLWIPASAEPEDTTPAAPEPSEPAPTQPAPTEPAPTQPAPTEPAPTQPAPTEPAPTDPSPTEPSEPASSEPTPSDTESTPTEPAPTDPAPTEPTPSQPTPTEPSRPAPTEPSRPTPTQPSQPTPTQPSAPVQEAERDPALIQSPPPPEVRLPSDTQIEFKQADGTPYYQIPEDWTAADVINWFIVNYGLDAETFAIEFYCPATGERCGWNENTFMLAASTYKLPLNMYYYEKQNAGVWSDTMEIGGTTLANAHYQSIVWSMNEISHEMLYNLGSYSTYKSLMLQSYGGMDKSEMPNEFWSNNYYSPHFMLNTLIYLYEHLDEFEELHGYMLQAMPGRYLQKYCGSVEVAHKYGTLQGHENDVGILFTEQPFLLAIYTQYVYSPIRGEELIGRIGAALIAYQSQRTELDQHPPEASEEATDATVTEPAGDAESTAPETEAPAEAVPETKPAETSVRTSAEPETPAKKAPWYFIAFPLIIILGAVGGILLFRKR